MPRIALGLLGSGVATICSLVALLLSDALAPGRLPPVFAFWAACAGGAMLVAGLALLERRANAGLGFRTPAAS